MSALSDFLTQDTSPWWVPLATLGLGSFSTYFFSSRRERQNLAIDDKRRFEQDILDLCVQIDRAVDEIHNNDPEYNIDDEEHGNPYKMTYFRAYDKIQQASDRLDLIGPKEIARIAGKARLAAWKMMPTRPDGGEFTMPELHEATVELRKAVRKYLRITD